MKNVLFVVDERKMGGVSIVLEDILDRLDYQRVHVDVLVLHDNGTRLKCIPKQVRLFYGTSFFSVIDLPLKTVISSRHPGLILRKLLLVLSMKFGFIKRIIKRERKKMQLSGYDVEVAFKDGFPALFTSCGDSLKKVHWLHYEYGEANPNKRYDRLFQSVMKCFDEIVAVSFGVLKSFEKEYDVSCPKRVIHNVMNIERILQMSKEPVEDIKKDGLLIGSVGRLHEVKGYDRFFNCLNILHKEGLLDSVKILLLGDGPQREQLQAFIEKNGLHDIIVLMGETENPYGIMKQMDVFVLPSHFESFGLVCLEALALDVPVIATKTAGTEDIFHMYGGGMLVDNTEEGILKGLRYVLENPARVADLKAKINYTPVSEDKKINEIMEVLCDDERVCSR